MNVLDPVRVPERAKPSRLVRWMLSLSTSPIPADFTNCPMLNAYLAGIARAGWTLRQAYYRNWTIWRNAGEDPHGLIVLPCERPRTGEDDFALFVAFEVLRCTKWPSPPGIHPVKRLIATLASVPDPVLLDRYRNVQRQLTRVRPWR